MGELNDQQWHRPWHNKPTVKVRHGKVDPCCNVGDEGGGKIIRNVWKRHGHEWFIDDAGEQDVGDNGDGAKGAL